MADSPRGRAGESTDSTAKEHPSSASKSPDSSSGNEVDKHPPDESEDEGSLDGSSDSEAETDQSDESRNKDLSEGLSEDFQGLAVSSKEEQETPQQNKNSNVASRGKPRRKLELDASQSHKGNQEETDLSEREDGKWLQNHPWECKKPNHKKPINKTVSKSEAYTVSDKWRKSGDKGDLKKIYLNLPEFIGEMKGPSIRQELEGVLNSTLLEVIASANTKFFPHVLEIAQKKNKVLPKDKLSIRKNGKNNSFKAFSLPTSSPPPSPPSRWFFDCGYMLEMHLPHYSLEWFNSDDQHGRRITKINPEKEDKRWVFIPSFRRAKIALLDWPEDPEDPEDYSVTQESTIRILVVRPSEFKEYVKYCGHKFPIICLPQDEIGAGYPRYWIQKFALRLKLHFIWMIDDSVECFCEYYPEQHPPKPGSYKKYRRRKFGLVFKRIEDFVKETEGNEKPIAAMSPRRFNVRYPLDTPFACKPPQCAVYLNIRVLSEKNVNYRPELKTFEDMIFGYECEQNGLKVYMDNRVHLKDKNWTDTGARSPSVKSK